MFPSSSPTEKQSPDLISNRRDLLLLLQSWLRCLCSDDVSVFRFSVASIFSYSFLLPVALHYEQRSIDASIFSLTRRRVLCLIGLSVSDISRTNYRDCEMNSGAKLAYAEEFLSDDQTYWMHGASFRYWLSDNAIKEKRRRSKNPEYCSTKCREKTARLKSDSTSKS
ncbi:unnamed protein product [Microthlaspi erraticum]|uniref:Uncharacterized protein n=1 Tax=Microthlaspi erraticum TaxID=1685480 RepID=A0A6D2I102_9BRAS|nr:unnamed protein product [Microthlaspi erraticum]